MCYLHKVDKNQSQTIDKRELNLYNQYIVKRLIINFIVQISSCQMRFCLITAKAPGSFAVTQAAYKRGGVESERNR